MTDRSGQQEPGSPVSGSPQTDSDERLLERFRRGEERAATLLYERYAGRLRAFVRNLSGVDLATRLDPDDLVQATFAAFFEGAAADRYRVAEGGLWKLLQVIAMNRVRSTGEHHRARKRDVRSTRADEGLLARAPDRQGGTQACAELRLLLAELLARLPPARQEVLRLRLQDYEVTEIAGQTGQSRRTIERMLHEFRNELRAELADD